MSYVMRVSLAIGAGAVAIAATACGGPASTVTSSSPSQVTPSPSTAPCTNPQVSAARAPASRLALTIGELPSGGPPLEQISDGKMNNVTNTDQRGFANPGNTYRIEDDIFLDASTQTATADYPQLRDATKMQFATLTTTSSPSGLGCQADEYVGKTNTGYSQVSIAFQDGDVIAIVLVENATAPVDPSFAAAVALAQDQKIVAAAS